MESRDGHVCFHRCGRACEIPHSRKATISGFAANSTRTLFANALKADRNHRFIRAISFNDLQISLYDREIGLLLESITYEDDSVINEILVGHNVKFSQ